MIWRHEKDMDIKSKTNQFNQSAYKVVLYFHGKYCQKIFICDTTKMFFFKLKKINNSLPQKDF